MRRAEQWQKRFAWEQAEPVANTTATVSPLALQFKLLLTCARQNNEATPSAPGSKPATPNARN